MARPHLSVLTGLRGVLCVWILAHNLQYSGPIVDTVSWPLFTGSLAVSCFFVLSGFVMTYQYGNHHFSSMDCVKHFLLKRSARLLPLYYLSQFLCCFIELSSMIDDGVNVWTIFHLIALLTCTNSWFSWPVYTLGSPIVRGSLGYSFFNPALWSISAEFGFYLIFPVLMRIFHRLIDVSTMNEIGRIDDGKLAYRLKRLIQLFGMFSITSLIPTFCYMILIDSPYSSIIYHVPWIRMSEFVLGMISCGLFLAMKQMKLAEIERSHHELVMTGHSMMRHFLSGIQSAYLLEILVLFIATLSILVGLPSLGIPQSILLHNPGTISCLFAWTILLMALVETNSKVSLVCYLLTSRAFVQLGVLSFAFYALHSLVQIVPRIIGANSINSFILAFFTCLGMSIIGHYGVEKPVYKVAIRALERGKCNCE